MVVDARPGAPKLSGSSSGGCGPAAQSLLSSLSPWRDLGTLSESLVSARGSHSEASCWVHGLTASVSWEHLGVGIRVSVGSGACVGSPSLPPCGGGWRTVWPTLNRRHSVLTDVGRIVAVPKAVLGPGRCLPTGPRVVGPGPNSSYACQCVAAPAVFGLELARAGPSRCQPKSGYRWTGPVACRAGSAQDLRRQMAPRIAVTSPISRTPHPRRRSHRRDQPMTTELYD
jgi:hypothetical protein